MFGTWRQQNSSSRSLQRCRVRGCVLQYTAWGRWLWLCWYLDLSPQAVLDDIFSHFIQSSGCQRKVIWLFPLSTSQSPAIGLWTSTIASLGSAPHPGPDLLHDKANQFLIRLIFLQKEHDHSASADASLHHPHLSYWTPWTESTEHNRNVLQNTLGRVKGVLEKHCHHTTVKWNEIQFPYTLQKHAEPGNRSDNQQAFLLHSE